MKRTNYLIFITLTLILSYSTLTYSQISVKNMESVIDFLASDSLKGRYPGTAEDSVLHEYIRKEFSSFGLKSTKNGYKQNFNLITQVKADSTNNLTYAHHSFIQGKDFQPLGFSGDSELAAKVVFCGYGIDFENNKIQRNDYKNIDPKGKWVLVFKSAPACNKELIENISDRDKAMMAQDKSAAGLLIVSTDTTNKEDNINTRLSLESNIDIPVIQISRKLTSLIFDQKINFAELEQQIKENVLTKEIRSKSKLSASIKLDKLQTTTANIVAILPGQDPKLKDKYIVIGAHHDHLGMGGIGSSSRMPDTIAIHNGADDNASGVSAVLELASYFGKKDKQLKHSLLFVTFGAEEKGLIGSKYFIENCPVPKENIYTMLNIDMLGRMTKDSILQIGGIGTTLESKKIVENVNKDYHLNLKLSEAGYGPSDHASFYAHDIPVFFFTTGAHQDYHTPFDDIDSLNFEGLALATKFISDVIVKIDNNSDKLSFQEAGPKQSSGHAYKGSVTLGIMPDVSGGDEGLRILAVTKGKPGYNGGIQKGDIIIGIDGHEIGNIYDYMYRLKTYKSGDVSIISILRNKEKIDLLINF